MNNRQVALVVALVLVLVAAAPAVAGKGGNPNGGSGNGNGGTSSDNGGNGGGQVSYTGYLTATPDVLRSGESFDVHGCGYDPDLGNVIVGFTGGSWGSALDSGGCFTITDIPALSGDTLPAGTYEVTAYQYVRGKLTETGDTTVTVVE
jgi:hypothetical protein